jgi:hypothetical protein
MHNNKLKIVVFDLDETLGYFVELGIFINALETILHTTISDNDFVKLLDLYPEFIRPNIMKILRYLKYKKKHNKTQVMIYTNNQGPREWVVKIKDYFENKLNYKLFDHIIAAFKVRGERIEMNRTSHDKTLDDFIRCTKLPKTTNICFLDDQYHPGMEHENVYYINLKPYKNTIDFNVMAERYYDSKMNTSDMDKDEFIKQITDNMKQYNIPIYSKKSDELQIDKIVGKKIIYHLEEFFKSQLQNNTRKKMRKSRHNKTMKII